MKLLFLLYFVELLKIADAQGSYGQEFYFGMFPSNDTIEEIRIDVASKTVGKMTTEVRFLNVSSQLFLIKGATIVHIPASLLSVSSYSGNRGIHLTATVPVSVTVTLVGRLMESYLALPVTTLGSSYRVAAYTSSSSYLLVGSFDNTTVHFSNSTVKEYSEILMNKSDTLQIVKELDLSNTAIWGNRKFSLMSGSSCSIVSDNVSISLCNFMIEQMVSSRLMSNYFIVPSLAPLQRYVLRSFSLNDTYHCYQNYSKHFCKSTKAVNNERLAFENSPTVVSSDISAAVVQYANGIDQYHSYPYHVHSFQRPFMMTVPGISNYLNEYYFAVPTVYNKISNYLCLIVPTESENGLRLDGEEINMTSRLYKETAPSPFSNYTIFKVNITVGYHKLNHTNKNVFFGALVFGIAQPLYRSHKVDGGYGFPAGIGADDADCSAKNCENGGSCTETMDGESCICATGYTGTRCEEELNECASNPCQNNGICLDRVGSFTCACVNGFTGKLCQAEQNECASNPCQNNGICLDGVSSFTCACVNGFTGVLCQIALETPTSSVLESCSSSLCQNNGTCVEVSNGVVCSCAVGYNGLFCEKVSETTVTKQAQSCESNPCQNGGTCFEVTNGFVCSCIEGFKGVRCETEQNPCGSCLNGGICKETSDRTTCYCLDGFSGKHCEKPAETAATSYTSNTTLIVAVVVAVAVIIALAMTGVILIKWKKTQFSGNSNVAVGFETRNDSVGIQNELFTQAGDNQTETEEAVSKLHENPYTSLSSGRR